MGRKRKRGSSFVMVIFITAIIFTTATTMIALVTNDYKNRIDQSKKLQNLYQSEAGIDRVYNLIVKNSDAAIVYANSMASEYITRNNLAAILVDDSESEIYRNVNDEFKQNFIKFLAGDNVGDDHSTINPIAQETNLNTVKKLIYGIQQEQFAVPEVDSSTVDNLNRLRNKIVANYRWDNIISPTIEANQEALIEINSYNVDRINRSITIVVTSTFNSIQNTTTGMANKKVIKTRFIINAPDYAQVINNTSTPIPVNLYSVQKAIVADKDLKINGGTTNVTGDVWIKGNDLEYSQSPNYAYEKYKTGILINNANFNVTGGSVYTNSTFNLRNKSESTISGGLYANNVYVGPLTSTDAEPPATIRNNFLEVTGDVITNNDLTLNSKLSTIQLGNYYGINDTTLTDATLTSATSTDSKKIISVSAAKDSSSIIVNEYNDSHLNINNATVMGVAYIQMDTNYKTGESVGVKGNYTAYSDILPGYADSVYLRNYNPLQLIQKIDGSEMSVQEKATYFENYYRSGRNTIKDGGVNITNLWSVGAFAKIGGHGEGSGISQERNNLVDTQKENFATNVFCMGSITGLAGDPSASTIYDRNTVQKTVSDQINFDRARFNYTPLNDNALNESKFRTRFGKLILNNEVDSDHTVYITRDRINIKSDGINTDSIDARDNAGVLNAVIITKGDVVIGDGDNPINFTGTIIAGGNVIIQGAGTKNIVYSQEVVRNITGKYNQVLEDVFTGVPLNASTPDIMNFTKVYTPSAIIDANAKYDAKSYLTTGLWKEVNNN